ncbi:MAG TPA: hypothetical protein VGB98_07580 [Pyrinomonadaceae bacterium]
MTKIKGLTVLVFTAVVFLIAHAQQPQGPPQRRAGGDKLNDAPQEDYPLMSLEEQKAAMRRIEEMRRKRRNNKLREKTPPAEWIQMPYHGLLLDANLDVIERTPENISKIQESIFAAVRKSARVDSLKKRGSELGVLFKDKKLGGQEKLVARDAALETLLAESDAATRARYEWRVRLLGGGPASGGGRAVISAALAKRLRDLRAVADTPAAPEARSEYVETCRAQGVPIPPDWPDARWISQGPLGLVFISAQYEAEVFAYKDPAVPGVCYALPRREGTSVALLGIICQSATTGYACFWDNKEADGTTPITGPDVRLDIDNIGNGRTLGENCTMCHRGDNVFNIHPQTVLQLRRAGAPGGPYETRSAMRYTPIGQPEWVNPPPLIMPAEPDDQGSCVTCHTLPQTAPPPGFPGRPYCTSVLEMAATLTMPPRGAPASWPGRDEPVNPLYQAHIEFLAGCP